uniref:RING-type domain-containing protein n=1 Tax=Calidris pygmaea TaxID=425635 RepID=A0A8C3KGN6_9CHAR
MSRGPPSPSSPPRGGSPFRQPLGPGRGDLDMLRCPSCLLLLWEPVTVSCGHSFCKPCLGGAVPARCPLCQERLKLLGVGAARCNVVLCGLLEKSLRMAQKGVELGKHHRARGVGACGCWVPRVSPTAEVGMLQLCLWSRRGPTRVTLSQRPLSLHGPELGDPGSWECWKSRAGGDGEWGSSCWAFLPCLQVARSDGKGLVAGQAPLLIPGCRAVGRAGHTARVPSATCFWR